MRSRQISSCLDSATLSPNPALLSESGAVVECLNLNLAYGSAYVEP